MKIESLKTIEIPEFIGSQVVGHTAKQLPARTDTLDTIRTAAAENGLHNSVSPAKVARFTSNNFSGISQKELSTQATIEQNNESRLLIQALLAHHYNFMRV